MLSLVNLRALREKSFRLAEIQTVLRKRKFLNPLDFFVKLPTQQKIIDDTTKIKFVGGGNRSSKTSLGACFVIERCQAKPRQRWWVCSETFSDSVNILQRKIWELLPKFETRYCYYDDVNGFRNRKLIFKNGSQIHFRSYDQGREAFASDDCDGILNDEEPPYEIYREQRMRLMDRNGEMIFTMTALKGFTDLVSEIFDGHDVIETRYAPFLGENLPVVAEKKGIRFFALWTTDNPYVDQSRVRDEIKLMTRDEIKSRIYGIPTSFAGKIFSIYNKQVHLVQESFVPKIKICLYNVLDPHDAKPWAIQWWVVHVTGTAYCVYEWPFGENFNEITADVKSYEEYAKIIRTIEVMLAAKYGRTVSARIIDPNFGNKTVQQAYRAGGTATTTPKRELEKLGLFYKDGIDGIEAGHLEVKKRLYYEEKDGVILKQPTVFIVDHCINTHNHLSHYSLKDILGADGDLKAKPQLTQKYKDYCDLARYFCMTGAKYIPRIPYAQEPERKLY